MTICKKLSGTTISKRKRFVRKIKAEFELFTLMFSLLSQFIKKKLPSAVFVQVEITPEYLRQKDPEAYSQLQAK